MPAQLALFMYVITSTLGLGYACVRGLTLTRRISVCGLALVLEISAAMLLLYPESAVAFAVGIPAMLALGLVMTAPRHRLPKTPPVTDRPAPALPLIPRQLGRRPPLNGRPVPVLTDPWAALYASMAGHVAHPGRAAEPANLGRRASDRRTVGRRVAARTLRRRRVASAAFSRSWKCKCQ